MRAQTPGSAQQPGFFGGGAVANVPLLCVASPLSLRTSTITLTAVLSSVAEVSLTWRLGIVRVLPVFVAEVLSAVVVLAYMPLRARARGPHHRGARHEGPARAVLSAFGDGANSRERPDARGCQFRIKTADS